MKNLIKFFQVCLMLSLAIMILFTLSCSSTIDKESSQNEIKSIAQQMIDGFNNRNLELLETVFAPTIIYHMNADEGTETKIKTFYDQNIEEYPDYKFTVGDMIAEGDKIAVQFIFEGTHNPSGKKVRFVDHWIGRVENGKFVEAWEVVDSYTWLNQLGYTITPPENEKLE